MTDNALTYLKLLSLATMGSSKSDSDSTSKPKSPKVHPMKNNFNLSDEEKEFRKEQLGKLRDMLENPTSKQGRQAAKLLKSLGFDFNMELGTGRRIGAPQSPPSGFTPVHLESIDSNLYLAKKEYLWKPENAVNVYGGQVVGQALAAGIKSAPNDKKLHSMHCYFLVGGNTNSDIVYTAMPIRDGNSFSSRLVIAQQGGTPIFVMIASFQIPEISSMMHQSLMPSVPSPEHCLPQEDLFKFFAEVDERCAPELKPFLLLKSQKERHSPIEMRYVVVNDWLKSFGEFDKQKYMNKDTLPDGFPRFTEPHERRTLMWIKARQKFTPDEVDDADFNRAVFAYASDMSLLSSAVGGKYSWMEVGMMASRDHSMWFHSAFRMDEWMLYDCESPRTEGGRGLSVGKLYRRDGTLAVTCTQEGVLRLKEDMENFKKKKVTQAAEKSKL